MSDFTYEALLDHFQAKGNMAALPASATATDRLMILGSIDTTSNEVSLQQFFVYTGRA